jgi:pyrroline-5-carboxylate reductase
VRNFPPSEPPLTTITGTLGIAILNGLINAPAENSIQLPFTRYIACVRSEPSEKRLTERFAQSMNKISISRGDNVQAVQNADVIILGADPADIETVLTQPGLREALTDKLLISIAAGWTRQKLETIIYGSVTTTENTTGRAWVVRTLPNIAAQVSQSLTAIETSEPALPERYLRITTSIFEQIGKAVHVDPRLMNATTAVGGSTPAFFAVICDAMIDAAVAVGVPRDLAHTMIFQSMQGTASMLQSGMHPALLKDQGTSPEGCTIGGLMVMEEAGVRGHVGRALREAVTLARLMETTDHVNDTRH